jgi:hypothetical protein
VRSIDSLDRRKNELNVYIKELVNRKDTRNSKEVIKFLELDKYAPENLFTKPELLEKLDFWGHLYVT